MAPFFRGRPATRALFRHGALAPPIPHDDLMRRLNRLAKGRPSIGFDEFMEVVLYDPDHGYYATRADRPTRTGDFLTAPEVTPLFGAAVYEWVRATWDETGADGFHYIEVGAGRGALAAAVAAAARDDGRAARLTLHLVERGRGRDNLQADLAGPNAHVYAGVDELPRSLGPGVFVANELFDNLPVRRVMQADGPKEIRLKVTPKRIREVLAPATPDLLELVEAHGLRLGEGQAAEVCPSAVPLFEAVLDRLDPGAFLVFDYGGAAHEVSGEAAPQGTVAAYRGHAKSHELYAHLGDQDVTTHVNFTPLLDAAADRAYEAGLGTQSRFLVEHGLPERFVERVAEAKDDFERLRLTQLAKQVYHPEAMGDAFLTFTGSRIPRKGAGKAPIVG